MSDKTYSGWTNYETWCVNLHIGNNESEYQAVMRVARDAEDAYDLAKSLKETYSDIANEIMAESNQECSMWADLLGAALSEVNWCEIAEHLISETKGEQL